MSSSQNLLVPFMRCMALGASRFPSSNTLTPLVVMLTWARGAPAAELRGRSSLMVRPFHHSPSLSLS
jgi:hypothetical protein